jgi:hypothetical protein
MATDYVDPDSIDLMLSDIANADQMHICSAKPANYAAVSGVTLGYVAMAGGDFTLADASGGNGRKLTVSSKDITATDTGTGTHLCLVDDGETTLKAAHEISGVLMTETESRTFASWDIPTTHDDT